MQKSEPKFEEISVKYLNDGEVAVVAFNRPKKFNSMAANNFDEMRETMEYLGGTDSKVRAIVLTGNGKHFCAGLDLKAAAQL